MAGRLGTGASASVVGPGNTSSSSRFPILGPTVEEAWQHPAAFLTRGLWHRLVGWVGMLTRADVRDGRAEASTATRWRTLEQG